ncbi:MAG: hypothetical protein R8F63_19630 [Acidimicrobiales bacterium]|nr:hypothetical protein [Acidimicrobiales bacterium]
MLADHLSEWDERMGSAAPILVALVFAALACSIVWIVRLRRRGLPDPGPGAVGLAIGTLVFAIVWLRLRGETDAFAELWNEIFLQQN